ncbi:hypothetical protein [Nonomuraea guangzhouensis]|uniref:Cysteine--tRNA ligase n=1 Tax=Nonomuraea guangzhouensis TaxID=1291555 RepID=A0ABW4GBH5_9ACTN
MVLPAGTRIDLGELRHLAEGGRAAAAPPPRPATAPAPAQITLEETARSCERRFQCAAAEPDLVAAARAVLDLEAELVKWAADTEEDAGGVDEARELLRLLIARLAEVSTTANLRSLVEPLLSFRDDLRGQGRYGDADALRAAMLSGGVLVEDTPDGPRWTASP